MLIVRQQMTNSDAGLVPFLLMFAEPIPASPAGEAAEAELPSTDSRLTKVERETTDDE
jgi:hypothetical protein